MNDSPFVPFIPMYVPSKEEIEDWYDEEKVYKRLMKLAKRIAEIHKEPSEHSTNTHSSSP